MDVLVLDTNFVAVGILDTYESLLWVDRYDRCGDFEIYTPYNRDFQNLIQPNYYLRISNSEHVMIVETLEIRSDAETGDYLTVTGRSLESILDRRVVWTQTTLSGNLQNAIKKLLNDAIIASSADRVIDNFLFQTSEENAITGLKLARAQYTGDNLYEVISELCRSSQIGFRIILNDDNQFVFSLYAGSDRSYRQEVNPYVVFSPEFENLTNSSYKIDFSSCKNVALIAGEGAGSSRKRTSIGIGKGLDRREVFVDARDISSTISGGTLDAASYTNLLKQRGYEKMTEYVIDEKFEGAADTSETYLYKEDFFLGDVVQVEDRYGNGAEARISEMIFSQDENGYSVYPTFEILH